MGEGDRAPSTAHQGGTVKEATDVRLTSGTKRLLALEASLALEPAFDASRVASLRAEIDRGTYYVDAERTAGRMLELERGLVG
jgi:negative regulator of flagellin synthesis FlgM